MHQNQNRTKAYRRTVNKDSLFQDAIEISYSKPFIPHASADESLNSWNIGPRTRRSKLTKVIIGPNAIIEEHVS